VFSVVVNNSQPKHHDIANRINAQDHAANEEEEDYDEVHSIVSTSTTSALHINESQRRALQRYGKEMVMTTSAPIMRLYDEQKEQQRASVDHDIGSLIEQKSDKTNDVVPVVCV
jgi:hypothetical protein